MGRAGILTNSTMVCAPLMARSVEQMVVDMQSAEAQGADAVEIRLDCIDSFQPSQDLETIIRNKPLPVIIVYRFYSIWCLNTISLSFVVFELSLITKRLKMTEKGWRRLGMEHVSLFLY